MALVDYSYVPKGTPGFTPDDEDAPGTYWTLEKCKRAYLDYLGSKNDEISEQKNSRCYRHGAQWTTQQVEIFNKRKQPIVTYNRIGRKIDSIVGLMEKIKQDPKAYPRNPRVTDEEGAELATATVRYVVEADLRESRFPFAIENGAVDGIGGIEMMLVRGDKGDIDVGFALVKTDSFFYDPRSFDHDFDDARFMGQGKWLEIEDARALAPTPEIAERIEATMQSGAQLTSQPDRERRWFDVDPSHKRVRVVDIWYKKDGGWKWCLFTGSMKIDEGKGYFFNEKNEPICKYIMFSSFVDHDGDRYGFPRGLRSSQDEINQRRSKGLHELNSRRIKAEDGAFSDIEIARREAVRPDGVVIYNKGFEMEFDDNARIANVEGQLKFLEDAKNEIENFGPSPALIGQGLEYKSGRAINLLQQAGIAELGPFVIAIKNWKLRIYRAIWCAVQRYWTAERWIRVTDDAGIAQLIQVNGVGIDPATGFPRLINAIGQLDVNFVLDEGPDEVNMMGDAYDTLVALTAQGANIPPQILLELAPLQGQLKRKLLALLEKKDPATEQAKSVAIASEAAKVDETKSKTALNMAKAQETAQGGAHGIVERQMDAAMAQDQHRMRMVETAAKVSTERTKASLKSQDEFMKLQSNQIRSAQDIRANAIKGAQDIRHAEEKQRVQLATMAAKANGGGAKAPKAPSVTIPIRGYQEGGRPPVGFPSLVGEGGPELFIPDQPGTIIPNTGLGRGRFAKELADPRVRDRLIAYTQAEVGGQGPEAQQAFMETIFNRAIARNQPLAQVLSGSYFPATTHTRAARPVGDTMRASYEPIIGKVMAGSNITNYATGNASGTVGFAGGPQTAAFGGERFGIEGPDKGWWTRVGAEGPGAPGSVGYTATPGLPGAAQRPIDLSTPAQPGGGFEPPVFRDFAAAGGAMPRIGLDTLSSGKYPTASGQVGLGGGLSASGSVTPPDRSQGGLLDWAALLNYRKPF